MADDTKPAAPTVQPPAQPDVLGPDHIGNPDYDPSHPDYVPAPPSDEVTKADA